MPRRTGFGKGNSREQGGDSLAVALGHRRVEVDCWFDWVAGMVGGLKWGEWSLFGG